MGLGPSEKMSLIRQRHQPPREALQQNGEKEAGQGLTQGPKGPPKTVLNNRGHERKQAVATGRTGEMQVSLH